MAGKKKKAVADAGRVFAVLFGVIGACWIFTDSWKEVAGYISGYRTEFNFFEYFFGERALIPLFPLAAILVALLFLIVSLRDLYPIAGTFSLVTAIFCAAEFLAYIVYFCAKIRSVGDICDYSFAMNAGRTVLLAAYFLFAMYCRNGGGVKNVSWVLALVAAAGIAGGLIYGYAVKKTDTAFLVNQLLVLLANGAVMYCGLRKY